MICLSGHQHRPARKHTKPKPIQTKNQKPNRRLDDAVAREDFAAAARLRDAAAAVSSKLPPVQRYVYSQLERLRGGGSNGSGSGTSNGSASSSGSNTISVRERRDAIAALGAAGSAAVIPELAAALHDASLSDAAHAALWAVFCRAPDPEVGELMAQAEPLLHAGGDAQLTAALALYDEAAARAPRFAEARNKRATALYLLRRYDEAVAACREALELNPHHFGAASGMGLCYWSLRQPAPALEAFEAALAIHPGLSAIRRHVETLREEVEAARRTAQQQPGQQQQQPGQQSAEEQ
jgi:tetratricopeptide (TPR) repeat protein